MKYTSIRELSELSGKEIIEKIERREVAINILEEIVSSKDLSRKFHNPLILTAILKVTDNEKLLINTFKKLLTENKLTNEDLYLFFTNPVLTKESFSLYSRYLNDEVIKVLNQADPRLEKMLNYIIENGLEKKEILFNPTLKDETKFNLIRKHKEDKDWLTAAIELNKLPEDIIDIIFNAFENIPYNSNLVTQELKKRHLDKLSTAAILNFLKTKKRDSKIVSYAISLIKKDIQPNFIVEIFSIYPNSIKDFGFESIYDFYKKIINRIIKAKELIKDLEKISDKYSYLGEKTYKSIIKDNGFKNEEELFNATNTLPLKYFFKYKNIKDNEVLNDVKEKFFSFTDKDLVEKSELYELMGIYLAKFLPANELFELMKRNDKKSDTIDMTILYRKDFIVTKEVMKYLLPKGNYNDRFKRIIVSNDKNKSIEFTYYKKYLLDYLVIVANENRITKDALKYFKKLVLDNNRYLTVEDSYYLPILRDYESVKEYLDKKGTHIINQHLFYHWFQNNKELPKDTLSYLLKNYENIFEERKKIVESINDVNDMLIKQKNIPLNFIKKYINNEEYIKSFFDRRFKLEDNYIIRLAYNAYKNNFLENFLSSNLIKNNKYSKKVYEYLLTLAAVEYKRDEILSYLNDAVKESKQKFPHKKVNFHSL